MAQRLRMTNADYVAIAVSPALIMALIGSLVFFLIEVLYAGQCVLRLNYVFALFVFATVLIARIAIELGSERAVLLSLPLGLVTFVALTKFIEYPWAFSWISNLALLAVVWWCAHKLTWDCTLIDDNEDASGEGLLGQVGLDGRDDDRSSAAATAGNELFAEGDEANAGRTPWWRRLFGAKDGPHTPGLWVLYFSLAALPLFGIGQHWIPSGDVGRRRYAFGLLAVYVAAALCLLVTTSFLGLRRYLRQRRVEMPAPMAATWVSLGAALILLVMFAAALVPRPSAEYELSQAPWQATSPGDQSASQVSVGDEGTNDPTAENRVTSDIVEAPPGNETGDGQDSPPNGEAADGDGSQQGGSERDESQQRDQGGSDSGESSEDAGGDDTPSNSDQSTVDGSASEQENEQPGDSSMSKVAEQGGSSSPARMLQSLSSSLANVLKLLLYAVLAAFIAYLAWRNREALVRAMSEIMRQLRELFARLFGGGASAAVAADDDSASKPRRRTFAEFKDPFANGRHRQLAPTELVRYTFEAFEAWAGDRGRPRTPDQTPQELVRSALAPQSPMYAQARQMVGLYSEAAYASATISREAAASLQPLWQMMRANQPPTRHSERSEESSAQPDPSLRSR